MTTAGLEDVTGAGAAVRSIAVLAAGGPAVAIAGREAIAEQDDQQGGAYRLELVSCGKPNCTRCAEGPAHGPYWYRYYRRGGKVVSKYVGKTLPAADTAEQAGHHRSGEPAPVAATGPPGDIPGQVRAAFSVLVVDPGPWTPPGSAASPGCASGCPAYRGPTWTPR